MLLLAAVSSFAQTTIRVPADQATIQAAINAASAGDTVLVAPGTYYENIDFKGKAITVTSSGGAEVTTIDGGGVATVVTFKTKETAASVISGFTITNGFGDFTGGGIDVNNASPKILNNVITHNAACEGGGINSDFGAPLIQGNTISYNYRSGCSPGRGGGISFGGQTSLGTVQIIDNVIAYNSMGEGGGISMNAAGKPVIRGNILVGNTASVGPGGGISIVNSSSPQIINNLIAGNTAYSEGGGVYWSIPANDPGILLLGNTIVDNGSTRGSGLFADGFDGNAKVYDNIIVGKKGQSAVYCGNSNDTNNPTMEYNDAYSDGASAYSGICGNPSGTNGNVSVDPLFVGPDVSNYHLQPGSPLIDTGNNSYAGIPALDLAGWQRIYDGNSDGTATIDIGAYEYAGTTTSTISTNSITFSDVQKVGTTSAAVVVTVTNTGDKTLDVSTISIPGDFTQTNTCRVIGGIAAGKTCTISFAFRPTARGARSGTATIVSNSTSSPQTITLQGTGSAPIISVEPISLTFGDQQLRTTSAAQVVTIRNIGDASLVISSITKSGDFAVSHTCGTVLPGGSCTASVTFTPQATRTRTGTLAIVHDAAGSPTYVSLAGNGIGPEITFSRTSIVFANQSVGTLSNPITLTVTNSGSLPLNISAVQITGDYQQTNNCVGTLQPGTSCQAAVSFRPLKYGARSGSISFTDNAAASPQSVALAGMGSAPLASLSTASITFPTTILVGMESSTIWLTYTNTGNEPLQIFGMATTSEFSQVNNCGAMLNPSASCDIGVKFKPSAAGTRTGTLQITDNAAGSPRYVYLVGVAIAAYPQPVLGSVSPTLFKIGADATLTVTGNGFYPTSVVYWGEQPLTTTYAGPMSISATVPGSLVADYTEYRVTVRTPSPGGGSSAQATVATYASIPATVRDMVYDPNRRLLYASTTSPNAILVIDPTTRQTSSIALNSDPNKLALSDNGQFLYVGLDGAGALARISLPAGTVDFQMSLGSDPSMGMRTAQDIKVLPGRPHSYVVSLACKGYSPKSAGIVVYDDKIPRPSTIASAMYSWVHGNSLLFMNSDATTLYGSDIDISDFSLYRFTIDSGGIVLRDSTRSLGGGALATDGQLLYESYGRIVDPTRPAQVGTYNAQFGGYLGAVLPEAASQRLFASEWSYIDSVTTNVLEVADLHSLNSLGSIKIPRTNSADIKAILRWGDNGIALRVGEQEIMLLRTALTGTPLATTPAPVPTLASVSPDSALSGTAGLTVTLTGSDFQPSSIVRWNGSNRQTTYVNSTTLTAALAASDLTGVGTAQITVFTPTPGGGTSAPLGFSIQGATISPDSLTFPETTVGLGASNQMVTFTNRSSEGVSVTPTVSGPFAIWSNFCTGTVAPGASCTMFIGYVPQVGGAETGSLSVSYTGAPAPLTVALSGTGIAKIQLSTSALTFAATNIGSGTSAQRIGILNRTGTNISISPSVTGSFWISSNSCGGWLPPNSGCYISVNYLASMPGQQTGQLTITPSVGSVETVSLTGTGIGGDIQMATTALTFAATNVGSGTSSQRVGVLNRTGVGITLAATLTGSFRISANSCTGTLAPNSGCYVFVQYRATQVGQQNGTLTITPSVGTVHEVSLTGTGQ